MNNKNLLLYLATLGRHGQLRSLCALVLAMIVMADPAVAGSATWTLNPTSNDWNTATNWTPQTVPDAETDVATFNVSNITDVSVASIFSLGGIVFNPGASPYTFAISQGYVGYISFKGSGVINNSEVTQNFDCVGNVGFAASATAGNAVVYTNTMVMAGPWISFIDTSDAGSATFINKGDSPGFVSAFLSFAEQSSAADSTIINEEGDTDGGDTTFYDFSTAGNSSITTYPGGFLEFENTSTGGTATLVVDGGRMFFVDSSSGGLARVELLHGGIFSLINHVDTPMTIGSLEGDSTGSVILGKRQLTVGGNGRSTIFGGLISGTGSLVRTGSETLTLTGANTYSGGTTITGGTLIAQARTGSATGTGTVKVNAGTLGGKGTVGGAVTIGTGSGSGAFLAPGATRPDTLILSKTLTFKTDGSYQCDLSLGQAKADQVSAKGVTIESGAQFVFLPKGLQMLTRGTVFTVINNTAATPISGAFANLAEGSKLSTGAGNKLRVSYTGGDGNDLTLTVVQ